MVFEGEHGGETIYTCDICGFGIQGKGEE